jgi:hypothetical protein
MSLPDHNGKSTARERYDEVVIPHDLGDSKKSIAAPGRTPRRLAIWGGNVVMAIAVVTAGVGLTRFGSHVAQQADKLEPVEAGGAGVIVRSEVLCLWLPPALSESAKRESQSGVSRTHEDLRRFLDAQHQQDLWYALTMRGFQVNGDFTDLTIIRRPYDDRAHLPALLDILATAAGERPREPAGEFANATVRVIPKELLKLEPRQAVAELLGRSSSGF